MTLYLLDTSVLVEWLRGSAPDLVDRLRRLDDFGNVHLSQPVAMEVLMSAPETRVAQTHTVLAGFPLLDVDAHTDFDTAAALYRAVRRAGHTVRSSIDYLIAAIALRNDAALVHRDRDFRHIAQVVPGLHTVDVLTH